MSSSAVAVSAAASRAGNAPAPKQVLELARRACQFLSSSTDPFHAVANSVQKLEAAGFTRLKSDGSLDRQVKAGGKYYYTVHQSTLVAFAVGKQFTATAASGGNGGGGGGGFLVIGGHTDSPNLKVKPRSSKSNAKAGCIQLGVECYGGGLWHTWFDRDLSLSGKVMTRDPGDGTVRNRLVQFQDPVARVSTLCIHLQTAEERAAFKVNKEDHTSPIIASSTMKPNKELETSATEQLTGTGSSTTPKDPWLENHEPLLLQRIVDKLGLSSVEEIADFDLSLYDTQPATIGGMNSEFLYSGRLDNLATVFCSIEALIQSSSDGMEASRDVCMVVCFDHEEVGSVSSHGAGSPVMAEAVRRVHAALGGTPQSYARTVSDSFCFSVDQAHAVHPNYASKHEAQHAPQMNGGIVIKTNSNQRYTTNSMTGFIVRELGRKCQIPIQEFVVRNDCPCGSTIGPAIASLTGIRTVDAGMPQLSMHSCREVMGTADLSHGLELFKGFFKHFREIDDNIVVED